MPCSNDLPRGHTVKEVSRYFRVSPNKIRAWIRSGKLDAIDTGDQPGRPRWVITQESLADFEAGRKTSPPARPTKRIKRSNLVDLHP